MNRIEEACPFDRGVRAARCTTCCSANQVPPCVAAYLAGEALKAPANVVSFQDAYTAAARKAA